MSKQKRKKPSGILGYAQAVSGATTTATFEKISFPHDKEGIERFIVDQFIYSGNREAKKRGSDYGFFLQDPVQNPIDDFDFEIKSMGELAYLELLEAAPLEHVKGGYAQAPNSYRPLEFAEDIFSKIVSKSSRYPPNLDRKLYLLVYVTHWTFFFNPLTINILQHLCNGTKLVFEDVLAYCPLDEREGVIYSLYPMAPESIPPMNLAELRDVVVINGDTSKVTLGGNSLIVPIQADLTPSE